MTLTFDGTRFIWLGGYETRHEPKNARFRWNPERKLWWTDEVRKAAALRSFADDKALAELGEITAPQVDESRVLSRAKDSEIDIPVNDGLAYMKFQRAGIAYGVQRAAVLIADEMGLGKTIQAIGIINCDDSMRRVLVVCPASLKINWHRELTKWLVQARTIGIANGGDMPNTDVVIINYDILKKHHDAIRAIAWDCLIVDEAHYTKNGKAIRSQHVWGHRAKVGSRWVQKVTAIPARRRIALTGTPICNRPIELFPILHGLDSQAWPSFFGFAQKFCNAHRTRFGWDFKGASNLDELQDKLRSTIMVRRLKKDVLTDLPEKIRQVIELPDDGCKAPIAAELDAYEKHQYMVAKLRELVEQAKASDDPEVFKAAVLKLRDSVQVAFADMSRVRKETAISKIPVLLKHLSTVLDDDDSPLVIFAHHREVVAKIREGLAEAGHTVVTITGDTHLEMRQLAVDDFQDGTARVFIGNIIAAGVGITLTRASHVVFAELDWVPGNVSQAEDRCHRIGQRDSVLVQHLVLAGSLDARMAKTIIEKQAVITSALDSTPAPEKPRTPQARPELADGQWILDGVMKLVRVAQSKGLAYPKIRLITEDGLQVRIAVCGEQSRYTGDVNLTDGGPYGSSKYYGRISKDTGKLYLGRDMTPNVMKLLGQFAKDPIGTAKLFAKITGRCCFCSKTLTDERSVGEGYGPWCAGKYDLPWGDNKAGGEIQVDLEESSE